MIVKDTLYMMDQKDHAFVISSSFKKELLRNLSKDLREKFGVGLDLKKIIGFFGHRNHSRLGVEPNYFDLLPLQKPGLSMAKMFTVVYSPHYSHFTNLFIQNLNVGEYILDPSKDVEVNSFEAFLEFEEFDIVSINKLIERDLKSKKIRLFTEYRFPVKAYMLQLDCELKVQFSDSLSPDEKTAIVYNVLADIERFNGKSESLKDGHIGLIHNVLEVKSQNKKGPNISFVVDLGSSGELGLKCILESLNTLDVPIELVEVK